MFCNFAANLHQTDMTSKTKSIDVKRSLLLVVVVLIAIVLGGMIVAFQGITIGNVWIIAAGALAIGLFSSMTLWRAWAVITGSRKFWVNYAVSVAMDILVLMNIYYGLNYLLTEKESRREPAVVERLYSETHHKSRRVGRNRYVQGEPYKVYRTEVRFMSGKKKELSMPFARWRRLHKGDTLHFNVSKGGLGMPVIHRDEVPVDVPSSSYSDHRLTR